MGLAHLDEAPSRELKAGHIDARWSFVGEAAGSVGIGVRRIVVASGGWSTPAHDHGIEEEIFYVLAGSGISWRAGRTHPVRAGDCIVHVAGRGAHTLHAPAEQLDVLAFGPRLDDEAPRFPRLGNSLVGGRWVQSSPGRVDGLPVQFVREAELGPPELPPRHEERPASIVNVADVAADRIERPRVARARRNLGRAAGSVTTGLQHVEVDAGMEGVPPHCHSVEEELFVVLGGDGVLVLDGEEIPVSRGHVVARPPATGVAHSFRAGEGGLTYLAYGTREPADVCFYPRSNKISFRGVGVIARLERLDYWDGED